MKNKSINKEYQRVHNRLYQRALFNSRKTGIFDWPSKEWEDYKKEWELNNDFVVYYKRKRICKRGHEYIVSGGCPKCKEGNVILTYYNNKHIKIEFDKPKDNKLIIIELPDSKITYEDVKSLIFKDNDKYL